MFDHTDPRVRKRQVPETDDLTSALGHGTISPEDYIRERVKRIGEGNILEFSILPLLKSLWASLLMWGNPLRH